MFRKLLKYDMKSVWNVWRIMAVTIFGLSIVGSFVLRYILEHGEKISYSITLSAMSAMFVLCAWLSLVTAVVVTVVFVFMRFYKNFFTDEGYLTFTLPVKRSTLLNVKTANAMLWFVLLAAFIVACALPFTVISIPSENGEPVNFEFYTFLWGVLKEAWIDGPIFFIPLVIGIVLIPISAIFLFVTSMELCITVGALLVKRAKILLGIGLFYMLSVVLSFAWRILSISNTLFLATRFGDFLNEATVNEQCVFAVLYILVICAMLTTVGFIFYSITHACIARRLNLA